MGLGDRSCWGFDREGRLLVAGFREGNGISRKMHLEFVRDLSGGRFRDDSSRPLSSWVEVVYNVEFRESDVVGGWIL